MALPGMPRHRDATDDEARGIADAKLPIEVHLERLGVVDGEGRARRRAVAISNRNLGTNHGHVAWQRGERPRLFRIHEDPILSRVASFLTVRSGGGIAIEELEIDPAQDRLLDRDGRDASDRIEWATVGQRVLRAGRVTPIEEIAADFYDVRHVLAFDPRREAGERIRQEIYAGYPATFAANVQRAWRERGVPRARYVHNAVGVNANEVIVVQREGTIEEIGQALVDAGADRRRDSRQRRKRRVLGVVGECLSRRHHLADGGLPPAGHVGDCVRVEGAGERRDARRKRVV